MERPASPAHPILDVLSRRWSPYSFSGRAIEPAKLKQIFEAMRWAASSYNEQPWRFLVATKDQPEEYARVLSCMFESNQMWAETAPLIGLTVTKLNFTRGDKPNRCHEHDLGLAMGNVCAQVTALDLFIHQMAGIEIEKTAREFGVPEGFRPFSGFAIGYGAEPDASSVESMNEAEKAPRERKPLSEVVFTGRFGEASPLVAD